MPIAGRRRYLTTTQQYHEVGSSKTLNFNNNNNQTDNNDGGKVSSVSTDQDAFGFFEPITTPALSTEGEVEKESMSSVLLSSKQHNPHSNNNKFSLNLSLQDPKAHLSCHNFHDNIPGLPCNNPRGYPHILDLGRYEYLNRADELHQIPMLVDAACTVVWYYEPAGLDRFLLASGPRFQYSLVSPAFRFCIEREAGKDEVVVRVGLRGHLKWKIAVKYSIIGRGQWIPLQAESLEHGRHLESEKIETIGTGLARSLLNTILNDEGPIEQNIDEGA